MSEDAFDDVGPWVLLGGAALLGVVVLAGVGGRRGGGLNAVGPGGWESCWLAFKPEAYEELVDRAVRDDAVGFRATRAVAVLYDAMEYARDDFLANPSLVNVPFDPRLVHGYRDLYEGIKYGDTSAFSADARAMLRMFLEGAHAYAKIALQVEKGQQEPDNRPIGTMHRYSFGVRVDDLARVICIDANKITDRSVRAMSEIIAMHERDLANVSGSTDPEDAKHTENIELNLHVIRDQLRKLQLRGVRPLKIVGFPAGRNW